MSFNFVYCLAGKANRFKNKGILIPKFLLPLCNDSTILCESLKSFQFGSDINLLLLINEEYKHYDNDIKKILRNFKFNSFVKYIKDTKGQAHTAYLSGKFIRENEWVFFFNGDTILKNRFLTNLIIYLKETNVDGFIDSFISNSDNYSFVKVNSSNFVIDIVEKKVISDLATTGLYGFKNITLYSDYYLKLVNNNSAGEEYISSIYREMISENKQIVNFTNNNKNDTIILGTPEEYSANSILYEKT